MYLLPLALVLAALMQPAAKQPTPSSQPKPAPAAPASPSIKATTPELHAGTEARHEQFNKISKEGKAQLVFLGDSITQGWESAGKDVWDKHYAKRDAANFGISGDRTEHVLWRLDHGNFDGLKPKLIVVMIGTNNGGHRREAGADTAAGVRTILDSLQKKCPDSKILLLAIFPRGENPEDPFRKLNDDANKLIEKFADGKKIVYKDISKSFLDDKGNMKKDLMPDVLHPNAAGYKVWADAMEPDIAKLLGETK